MTTMKMTKLKTDRLQKIKSECFWDYTITPEEIEKIITQGTKGEKKALFQKLSTTCLTNSI